MGNKLDNPELELPPEKLVMVTGGNTGIGYETAKAVAEMGARTCIACRSEDKAKAAIERMQTEHRNEVQKKRQGQSQPSAENSTEEAAVKPLSVEYIKLDLSSLQSTMDFIQETKQRMQSLNILVCNAGIAFVKQDYTDDNFETHFQVNYLSHLLLAIHLMPLLRAGGPDSRIILLSSSVHSNGKLDLDNMQSRKSYSRISAYSSSKAYMIMAAHFLARRLDGTGVSTFSVDPGIVDTDIVHNYSDLTLMSLIVGAASKLGMMRTPKQGAMTSVLACVDPNLCGKTAIYMKNCRPANPADFCRDESKQETLWRYSLGCLDQYISEDVLKEAFPSARPDLMTIPKDARTVAEKIADDLPKQGGSSEGKDPETEEQPSEGGESSEQKQGETQPKNEAAAAATATAAAAAAAAATATAAAQGSQNL